jgi:hypothetical protein
LNVRRSKTLKGKTSGNNKGNKSGSVSIGSVAGRILTKECGGSSFRAQEFRK